MADYTEEHARAGIKTRTSGAGNLAQPVSRATSSPPVSRNILRSAPRPACPTSASSPSVTCPRKECLELKSLKMYLLAYRDLGIFYENAVNKILHDIVKAIRPKWCIVRGEFTPRGGLTTSVFARWPASSASSPKRSRRRGDPRSIIPAWTHSRLQSDNFRRTLAEGDASEYT